MKLVNGKIVEATESELYELYLKDGWDTIMPFQHYLKGMEKANVKIVAPPYKKVIISWCGKEYKVGGNQNG